METIFFEKPAVIKKEKANMEKQLKVKINITGRKIDIEGAALDEYIASIVLDAISFGFTPMQALSLKSEDMIFKKIHIRDFTRRKSLSDVRARLIGTQGKTRRTLEEISDCSIVVNENAVGIIGPTSAIDNTVQAVINIIRGSKQANIYRFLERMNTQKEDLADLGLKRKKEK